MFCNLNNECWTKSLFFQRPPATFGCRGFQVVLSVNQGVSLSIKGSQCFSGPQRNTSSGACASPPTSPPHQPPVQCEPHAFPSFYQPNLFQWLSPPLHTALKVILSSDKEGRKKSNFKQAIIKLSFACVPFPTRDRGGNFMPA